VTAREQERDTVAVPGPSASGAGMGETGAVLEVRRLLKRFPIGSMFRPKHVHALNGVSFSIKRGQVVALVGESGSGKSTAAKLIARLIPPTGGEIIFRGRDVLKTEPRRASLKYRSEVQMIFQDPFGSLNPVHTVGYHIARPLQIHKLAGGRAVEEKVLELLATVGLTPPEYMAKKHPHQLSGGQRQRVAVARALAVDPQIIVADEPISMLDVSIRMGVLNLMEKLKEERQIGYLYITHDIASARYIGDLTLVMYAGYIVEGAESDDLMQSPAHPYTKLLLSAVPNPHVGLSTRTIEARGEVPSLIDPPPGCPFAARCPHVMKVCRETMPEPEAIGANHWVRCHLFGAGKAAPAAPAPAVAGG
jgi:peptide/nickel transport system ATP-binding protein